MGDRDGACGAGALTSAPTSSGVSARFAFPPQPTTCFATHPCKGLPRRGGGVIGWREGQQAAGAVGSACLMGIRGRLGERSAGQALGVHTGDVIVGVVSEPFPSKRWIHPRIEVHTARG